MLLGGALVVALLLCCFVALLLCCFVGVGEEAFRYYRENANRRAEVNECSIHVVKRSVNCSALGYFDQGAERIFLLVQYVKILLKVVLSLDRRTLELAACFECFVVIDLFTFLFFFFFNVLSAFDELVKVRYLLG